MRKKKTFMAKFAIATMLIIFLSFNTFFSISALTLPAEGLQKHQVIRDLSGEGRYKSLLLHGCKGGNACIERGLGLSSLRKKQPVPPPAPTRNSKKIHVIVRQSVKAFVHESAPPSPP